MHKYIPKIHSRKSLSARRAWIEMYYVKAKGDLNRSLSARRAWIEMQIGRQCEIINLVALRKESVDRNIGQQGQTGNASVALRKESVDRNFLE